MLNRRELLKVFSVWLAGLTVSRLGWSAQADETTEILMGSDPAGSRVYFDPIGLLVRPGRRIRWVNAGNNVHTATAYHPANDGHPLRIPEGAEPWDSGYLVNPGDSFEVRLTAAGVYDYYCKPHEAAGMVGRIIVTGGEIQPETIRPYPDDPGNPDWRKIPEAALRNFPSIETILRRGIVRGSG